MELNESVLKREEKAVFALRGLYQKFGYAQYKMSKFEEYDLYVRNKDFLVSENIITFTDTDGKLMALKPDVTLSIIKNTKDEPGLVQKLYYNENVYRVSKGTHSFKEIMQAGLECIGDIDVYSIFETVMLAAKSLETIAPDYILDISHMGIVTAVIELLGEPFKQKDAVLKCIAEKNTHTILNLCEEAGVDKKAAEAVIQLTKTYGKPDEVIEKLKNMGGNEKFMQALSELEQLISLLKDCGMADKIRIDFSVVNDMNYYNGVVFKGFVNGIPTGILSGGQYDKLLQKMGRKSGAVGFAVYLDLLERLSEPEEKYDVDTVVLYDKHADFSALSSAVRMLTDNGKSVTALKSVPEKLRFRQLLKLNERGLEILENNG